MGLSFKLIAKRLEIGIGTAHRLYRRFISTGDFKPCSRQSTRPEARKLDELHEIYIIGLLLDNPGLYLNEICSKIKAATGVSVSGSTVCRMLCNNGYTRKKIMTIAKQRCATFRGAFMAQIMHYPLEFYVWLDETGSNRKDHFRKFGYQLRGLTPVYHRDTNKGTRVSSIVAMNSEGLLGYELLIGTTNGDTFFDFVRGTLIPNMQPFPAMNSILIMDNCSIHHVQQVKDLMTSVGILVHFLPPYSPDYNPCEELFSYVKYYLKNHDEILQSIPSTDFHKQVLQSAFMSVTKATPIKFVVSPCPPAHPHQNFNFSLLFN